MHLNLYIHCKLQVFCIVAYLSDYACLMSIYVKIIQYIFCICVFGKHNCIYVFSVILHLKSFYMEWRELIVKEIIGLCVKNKENRRVIKNHCLINYMFWLTSFSSLFYDKKYLFLNARACIFLNEKCVVFKWPIAVFLSVIFKS